MRLNSVSSSCRLKESPVCYTRDTYLGTYLHSIERALNRYISVSLVCPHMPAYTKKLGSAIGTVIFLWQALGRQTPIPVNLLDTEAWPVLGYAAQVLEH